MQGQADSNVALLDAAGLVGHLVDEASIFGFLAEHREQLFPDGLFADLFPSRTGRPSVPGPVAATVMVLQALEGLSDREAVERLRCDIRWKVACGLALDDVGFHATTLTYWRRRLAASTAPERIFEAVRKVVAETGLLAASTRRALDSTVLEDAVATQDTVTQLVAQIRRVRRQVPKAAGVEVGACDYSLPGKPACDWRDPDARRALVSGLVTDALAILATVEEAELTASQQEAVGLLALVAGQDVEQAGEPGRWRIARGTAAGRVVSTVDPEARHVHKNRTRHVEGYKAHIAVEPDTGVVSAATLSSGTTYDGDVAAELVAGEAGPVEVVADAGYSATRVRKQLTAAGHQVVIKPPPARAAIPGGFTLDDFTVDTEAGTVTCPAGQTVAISPAGAARFGSLCASCPLKDRCTRASRGRIIKLKPATLAQIQARTEADEPAWQHTYRRHRPMVERSIAWLVAKGRRVPYRGIARNRIWLAHRAAAVNLTRLLNLGLTHQQEGWVLPAPG